MQKNGSELIEALSAIEPRTKAAKVRAVMPLIEQRIAAGVRIADILVAMNSSGLDITEATLKSYLYRYRKKKGRPTKRQAMSTATEKNVSYETDLPENKNQPVLMQQLDRLLKPDPETLADDVKRYERLAKQHRNRK